MKKVALIIILIFLFNQFGASALHERFYNDIGTSESLSNEDTEYWALLVGCNEFLNKPDIGLPGNDISAEDLRDLLLVSEHWTKDHIKVLTGKNATWFNIIKGLFWLDFMDDEDDICLIYISTHGAGGMGIDLYPWDEEDGDEMLMTYDTYRTRIGNWYINFPLRTHWITDDMLNKAIDRMDAKGVCAIINACYCEYGDGSDSNILDISKADLRSYNNKISASEWMGEFAKDLVTTDRIILMACSPDEMSLGTVFSYSVMEGLQGFCDSNNDTICSAEEAFAYSIGRSQAFLNREFNFPQNPQMYDGYPSELGLTTRELPPGPSELTGLLTGYSNKECTFNISSTDAEENDILYNVNWGDENEERTTLHPSGDIVEIKHSWSEEGTYNIWFDNEDEYGANFHEFVFPDKISITISDGCTVDQHQTMTFLEQCFNDEYISNSRWLAQSFVPSESTLSKVDLETWISLVNSNEVGPLHISIRSNLTGEDLTETLQMPQQISCHMIPLIPKPLWTTFDFPDITLSPGEEYYIVCRFDTNSIGSWLYAGVDYGHDPDYQGDPYTNGTAYFSTNAGSSWYECPKLHDFCFVTYG